MSVKTPLLAVTQGAHYVTEKPQFVFIKKKRKMKIETKSGKILNNITSKMSCIIKAVILW